LTLNKLNVIISPRSQGENKEKESPKLQEVTRNELHTKTTRKNGAIQNYFAIDITRMGGQL
jgi:hypothetical protein